MLQRWNRMRIGTRWLVLGVALFAAYVLFMVPADRGVYVFVARGIDAAGQGWAVSAGSQDTRYFGVALEQRATATWSPGASAAGGAPVKLVLPFTPRVWTTGAPAVNGRFVQPWPGDTYALADVEDAAARAALADPSLSASVERYLWPGVVLRVVVPVAGFLLVAALMFFLVSIVPRDTSRCSRCNYPLIAHRDGTPGRLCPECGTTESRA